MDRLITYIHTYIHTHIYVHVMDCMHYTQTRCDVCIYIYILHCPSLPGSRVAHTYTSASEKVRGKYIPIITAALVRRQRVIRSQRARQWTRSNVVCRLRVAIDLSYTPASDKEARSLAKQLAVCVGLQRKYASIQCDKNDDGQRRSIADMSSKSRKRLLALQAQKNVTNTAGFVSPYRAELFFVGPSVAMAEQTGLAKWAASSDIVSIIHGCTGSEHSNHDIDTSRAFFSKSSSGATEDDVRRRDHIVYLSPDADLVLDYEAETMHGNGNTIFVIGGIVDLEATPRMSLRRASELQNVGAVRRLPVREMVHGGVRRGSLTVNQVLEVLFKLDAGATMYDALNTVVRDPM